MPDLTARITEILAEHQFAPCTDEHEGECIGATCTWKGNWWPDWRAHVAALIAAEFRREERQIDYGLGSLGVEKRTQVRYVTPWETQ